MKKLIVLIITLGSLISCIDKNSAIDKLAYLTTCIKNKSVIYFTFRETTFENDVDFLIKYKDNYGISQTKFVSFAEQEIIYLLSLDGNVMKTELSYKDMAIFIRSCYNAGVENSEIRKRWNKI